MTRSGLVVGLALAATVGLVLANPAKADTVLARGGAVLAADPVYQIDNGQFTTNFNNTLGTETTSNQAEDNWVANVFTAKAGANLLTSISFLAGFAQIGDGGLDPSTLPSPFVTAALYTGAPGAGLTLVAGSVNTVALNSPGSEFINVPFATPQMVATGQVFTAALLISDVPSTVFPFTIDTSGDSTGSYFDISNPVGSVNNYNLGSPNFPTLNGETYPGQPDGATNAFLGKTFLRVNAVPEPASLLMFGMGTASVLVCCWRRRTSTAGARP
jgi:hypothetical protein